MTAYDEIVSLRRNGNTMGSYDMAMKVKSEDPSCLWVFNQIGWCLYEIINTNSSVSNRDEFLVRLQEYADVNKERTIDPDITKRLVWPIRSFVTSCVTPNFVAEDVLYRTFGIIQQISFDVDDENYHILLRAFLKAKKWGGLKQFIDWWNLDNIKEKDCEPYITNDGKKVMSVAEQAYIAYSNILFDEISNNMEDEEHVAAFSEKLSDIARRHPEFQYPSYFQAKLLLGIGHKDDAIMALLPFVKKKPKDYWVWDLLGDAENDDVLRISCYCKALSCYGKEQYLRKLHLKLCDLLLKKELYNEARAELVAAIAISEKNGWGMPYKYKDYTTETWYLNTDKTSDNSDFYKNNSTAAEQLIYANYTQMAIVIVKINKEKQVANFISAEHKEGFFSCKSINCKLGGAYICRMENNDKNHYKVYTCEPINGVENGLIKEFSGQLSIKQGGFGFVDGVFVHASIINGRENNSIVSGLALPAFDEKKGTWGWRAYKLK